MTQPLAPQAGTAGVWEALAPQGLPEGLSVARWTPRTCRLVGAPTCDVTLTCEPHLSCMGCTSNAGRSVIVDMGTLHWQAWLPTTGSGAGRALLWALVAQAGQHCCSVEQQADARAGWALA